MSKAEQLQEGIAEMEAAVERLREEIQRLTKERDALQNGNLDLYHELTRADF
nr:hypothetical protein [Streptomyces globisporus]